MTKNPATITRAVPLMNQLVGLIEKDIASGRIRPGDRLVESKLAQTFGVSRGPVRDALKAIEAGGLAQQRNGGLHVISPTLDEAERMFVMRAQLEGLAARYVAADWSDKIDAALRKIFSSMQRAAKDKDRLALVELDWSFHETVCSSAPDPFLLETWRSMRAMIRILQGVNLSVGADLNALAKRHLELIEVLASGDPDRAEATFRRGIIDYGFRQIGRPVPRAFESIVQPVRQGKRP